jgi:sporulation-control protein spo0M
MTIKTKFNIGQVVYLRTDIEQEARIITGVIVRYSGVLYYLTCGTNETVHYDFEFSLTKNTLITLNIESNLKEHE